MKKIILTVLLAICLASLAGLTSCNIILKDIKSISLATQPERVYFIGDNLSDFNINVNYEKDKRSISSKDLTIKNFNTKTVGTRTATLTYYSFSLTFEYVVLDGAISITTNGEKLAGDNLLDAVSSKDIADITDITINSGYLSGADFVNFKNFTNLANLTIDMAVEIDEDITSGNAKYRTSMPASIKTIDLGRMTAIPRIFENDKESINQVTALNASEVHQYALRDSKIEKVNAPILEVIQSDTFSNCGNLNSFTFDSVKVIGSNAFANANKVLSTNNGINGSSVRYNKYAYKLNMPNLEYVGNYAFRRGHPDPSIGEQDGYIKDNKNYVAIIAPKLKEIGVWAFSGIKTIRYFQAENTNKIGASAFKFCTKLDLFDFSSVNIIEMRAFYQCGELKGKLDLTNLNELGNEAFHNCDEITSANFKTGLNIVGDPFTGNCSIEYPY